MRKLEMPGEGLYKATPRGIYTLTHDMVVIVVWKIERAVFNMQPRSVSGSRPSSLQFSECTRVFLCTNCHLLFF